MDLVDIVKAGLPKSVALQARRIAASPGSSKQDLAQFADTMPNAYMRNQVLSQGYGTRSGLMRASQGAAEGQLARGTALQAGLARDQAQAARRVKRLRLLPGGLGAGAKRRAQTQAADAGSRLGAVQQQNAALADRSNSLGRFAGSLSSSGRGFRDQARSAL